MKKSLFKLCELFGDSVVEKHLFKFYLDSNNIDQQNSEIIEDYLKDFNLNKELMNEINSLKIITFEDLEKSQELLIPPNDRKINGAFFTPRKIVNKIIEEVSPLENESCVDLSCGCGAFLIGLIKFFKENHNKSIKDSLRENIYGYDILDYNIRRSKILITIFGLENGEVINYSDFNLISCDSLKYDWDIKFDIVVGNPPYVKFQDLDQALRNYLIDNYETIAKGTFNLYFAFFELGYKLIKENGRLGYITPNNYFTSLSGVNLRNYFSKKKAIYKIIDFNSKKVFDVLTYTALTFLDKKNKKSILFNKYFSGDFNQFIDSLTEGLSSVAYSNLKDKKWRLLLDKDQLNIHKIENSGRQIGDLFTINVGIATLRDDLYIIDGQDSNGYFKLFKEVKYYIEKDLIKSLYKISDFNNQIECDQNQKKIIFPYRVVNNKSIFIDEKDMESSYSLAWKYFSVIKEHLQLRTKQKILNPFYQYGRSQGLNKFGIRLLTPTFSQKPKFLKVTEKDSLYCNGYGIHFKNDQNKLSIFDVSSIQSSSFIGVLQKILNSDVMDYYVKTTSVTIDGGYPCYQKNFIELFTIPELSEGELISLDKLSIEEFNEKLLEIYDLNLSL